MLTGDGGTIGLLTDAVNVLPGIPFTVRVNSFKVTDNMFWALVLTTSDGAIKEFISPVSNWTSGAGKGLKMNVNCCVKEATVREGNLIRFATSYNNKIWALVKGENDDIVDALPALNNQTPVYNFTFPEDLAEKANLSGVVTSAVRGRDLTFKITPKSASHTLDVVINGDTIIKGGKTFTHSFIAKEDLNFDIKVIPPVTYTEATIILKEGEHLYLSGDEGISNWGDINYATAQKYQNIKKLKIVGKLDYYDFNLFRENYMIAANIRHLDLSEATFVRNRDVDTTNGLDNLFPSEALYNKQLGGCFIEEIILPSTLTQFGEYSFKGCSRLKEIRLPANLRNWSTGPTLKYGYNVNAVGNLTRGGLYDNVFDGCNALETIYFPYSPGSDGRVGHWYYSRYHALKTGMADNTKVTVVVPADKVSVYKTPYLTDGDSASQWSNGWEAAGFNIVGEYPVYSLEYDASRCFTADVIPDMTKAASFLKDNIGLEQIERKIYIGKKSQITENRPEGMDDFDADCKIKVYDNGTLLSEDAFAADGSVTVTYYNPNRHADRSGDHTLKVLYFYDVHFNCASENLQVVSEDGSLLTSSELSENTSVRFKVNMDNLNSEELTAMVKVGETALTADDEGFYNVEVTDRNIDIYVYAVPRNGATLTAADMEVINAAEANNVKQITFTGEVDSNKLIEVINAFPELEEVDLSGITTALPAGAMAGKETLTTVMLPQAEDIEAGTFSGCVNLRNVSVPETVNYIGENAFNGCSSLENLSFTGVKGIGANAFNGCDNLTTIIFNTQRGETAARARRVSRAARVEGYTTEAFSGLNPNCLVYLDEGIAIPEAIRANYIKVMTQEINGEKTRVYQTTGDLTLDPGYPFHAINTITVSEGNEISMEMDLEPSDGKSAWSPMVIPFAPTKVTDASGKEMVIYADSSAAPKSGKNYMVATMKSGDIELSLADQIDANRPYVVGTHKSTPGGKVRFATTGGTMSETPEEIRVEGEGYSLIGTYKNRQLDPATTYQLDANGSSFVASDSAGELADDGISAYAETDDAATVQVDPFSVYVEAPENSQPVDINIPIADDIISGIDDIASGSAKLRILRDGDRLVIYAGVACEVKVFSVDGILVKVLHLSAGSNTVSDLAAGVYILNGVKTIL